MTTTISQRQLRNESGEIMRRVEAGEVFIITRNGVPVGELRPLSRRQRFVPREQALAAFAGAPHIDAKRFFADIDAIVDQDPTPRA